MKPRQRISVRPGAKRPVSRNAGVSEPPKVKRRLTKPAKVIKPAKASRVAKPKPKKPAARVLKRPPVAKRPVARRVRNPIAGRKVAGRARRPVRKVSPSPAVSISEILSGIARRKPAIAKAAPVVVSPPTSAEPFAAPPTRLPESYGTKQVTVVARDPRWLYARWDLTREQMSGLQQLSAAGHLSVRVYRDSASSEPIKQLDLQPHARYVFVPVAHGEVRYIVELGYVAQRAGWVSVAFSKPVLTPADTLAVEQKPVFATLPLSFSFSRIAESLGLAADEPGPLIEAIARSAANRAQPLAGEVSVSEPVWHWTPERARKLARAMGRAVIRRSMLGDLSSLVAAHVLSAEAIDLPELEELSESPDAAGDFTSPAGGWSGDLAVSFDE